ncbi:hypothetical protein BOX15_Mlig000003g2 [Macrostomum lignano]|uniref:Egal-1 winged helix domain-containing protein n=1 Tax=Macrostomum lignano TaxID=282301 RepID=A0A267FTJ6_9PLAT|nr:hypothetical protein BOX15_Mlig000003g2 [Macrostomum lignano]
MSDPAHKAMLYFLEILLNCTDSEDNGDSTTVGGSADASSDSGGGGDDGSGVRLSSLAAHFHSRHFDVEMRNAVGGPAGLRAFLRRYPALFRVVGDRVRAVGPTGKSASVAAVAAAAAAASAANSNSATSSVAEAATADLERDLGAVRFLQSRLAAKRERWVPVRSLCGHLGQAPSDVRAALGLSGGGSAAVELAAFLAKHRHAFEVQGELVSLRNGGGGGGGSGGGSGGGRQSSARRPGSLALGSQQQQQQQQQNHHLISAGSSGRSLPSTPNGFQQQQQQHQVHMSAAEYKAVMFVRKVLLKKGGRMPLAKLFTVLSRPGDGAEQARNLIGWTQMELEEFLAKRPLFFDCCSSLVSDSAEVAVRRGQRLSIVISESATTAAAASAAAAAAAPTPAQSVNGGEAPRTLSNRCGTVFHCSRLWGIIDLGRHEHVFFDRSIFKHVEDLQRHFKVNDPVYFNAILAPRESRAKWRATKVWKECDRPLVDRMSAAAAAASIVSPLSPSPSPAAPLRRLLSAASRGLRLLKPKLRQPRPSSAACWTACWSARRRPCRLLLRRLRASAAPAGCACHAGSAADPAVVWQQPASQWPARHSAPATSC